MDTAMLRGEWIATQEGTQETAHLYLGAHPEWKGMVKGEVERAGQRRAMVGDVDDGNVTLEESANGTNISATWVGEVTEGSCAREIRGQLIEGDDAPARNFVLRKHHP